MVGMSRSIIITAYWLPVSWVVVPICGALALACNNYMAIVSIFTWRFHGLDVVEWCPAPCAFDGIAGRSVGAGKMGGKIRRAASRSATASRARLLGSS